MVLSEEEITGCREAFLSFDKDRSGTIDVWELRQVLEALGQAPTEDELFQVSEVAWPALAMSIYGFISYIYIYIHTYF
jgi:Ca2+-binding EF-hand superfamily protein